MKDIARHIAALSPEQRALLELRAKKRTREGHSIIARTLADLGITHVYGINGTPINETLSACVTVGLRAVGVRHQQAAVMMSIAQNYVTGRLCSVVILSAGPAVTNAATGILVAKDNCWPLLVIGGRRSLQTHNKGAFQSLDGVALYEPLTKHSAVIDSSNELDEQLRQAAQITMAGRPGPVYLDITEQALRGFCTPSAKVYKPPAKIHASVKTSEIEQAAQLIMNAKRPGIILGKGLRWSQPYNELRKLVEQYHIPFVSSPMGRGYLPDDHALCFNTIGTQFRANVDTLLVLGARLDWTFRFGSEFDDSLNLIHVDIDHDEIGRNTTPLLGINADAGVFLGALLKELESQACASNQLTRTEQIKPWLTLLNHYRSSITEELRAVAENSTLPMTPSRMLKEVREVIPRDTLCVVDGNVILAASERLLPSYLPASRLTSGSNGCLGVGIPFAIGAKLALPERPVIVIMGDTAFGFNPMELETAVRYKVPIIVIVANNGGISGALHQESFYPQDHPDRIATFQPGIRYDQIIEAFGGHACDAQTPEQIKLSVKQALKLNLPTCINVRVDPYAPYSGAIVR